ncbi:hypothetical protein [Prochlorothrix hollandica]|uniref:hypothetical protein n=1 Tax=Prochlorothrix hollandica TaxID=1223 RepID=UPI0011D1E8DE|nr:hypothetical protein [Prochlorothrix hollandica]
MTNTLKRPETPQRQTEVVIELAQGVLAHTKVPVVNHSALRSGFAGQPANPRWNATKVVAWKTGRQWRSALAQGSMVVRPTDSMLIPIAEQIPQRHLRLEGPFCFLWDSLNRRTHPPATHPPQNTSPLAKPLVDQG